VSEVRTDTRRPLSRDAILNAALTLADEQGLEALSMRRLAAQLGVEAMSLYNHIPSKAALLAGLLARTLMGIGTAHGEGRDWSDELRTIALATRAVAQRHPCFVQLLTSQQLHTDEMLLPVEATLRSLHAAGLDLEQTAQAYQTIVGYVVGFLLQERSGVIGISCCGGAGDPPDPTLPTPNSVPLIRRVQEDGTAGDRSFEFGLDLLIAGLSTRLPGARPRAVG